MENIYIKKTSNSPEVILDYEKGVIEFDGKSYPENTFDFYKPIVEWIEEYFHNEHMISTTINIKLTYFNSVTTQILFDIFDTIEESENKKLVVYWYYDAENENGLEDYEDYASEFSNLDIQAVAYKK